MCPFGEPAHLRKKRARLKNLPYQSQSVVMEDRMQYTNFILTVFLVMVQTSVVKTSARLDGLDRLYFQHVGKPGEALDAPPAVASLLPKLLRESDFSRKPISIEGFNVRDFRLPSELWGRKLWLRQIIDLGHPRITELWWALYDHERRSDVWYFSPLTQTKDKILSNYEIKDVSTAGKDSVVLRIQGSMFRPGGAWWEVGKVLTFSASEDGLTFSRVRNAFGFFHGYDPGNEYTVSTEQESRGRFEERTFISKQENTLRRCGSPDPLVDGEPKLSWRELERVALCITRRPSAKRSSRAFKEPSFVERGGPPQK